MLSHHAPFTALGNTVKEIELDTLGPLHLATVEKSMFSMLTPEIDAALKQHNIKSIIIMGIEVCVPFATATRAG